MFIDDIIWVSATGNTTNEIIQNLYVTFEKFQLKLLLRTLNLNKKGKHRIFRDKVHYR